MTNIILCGGNTAPAIALACMALPKDEKEYAKVLAKAKDLADTDNLVTFWCSRG